MKKCGIACGLALLFLLLSVADGSAQTGTANVYAIGVGDRLRVSVWQESSLDRDVEVGMDSTIVLPLVGTIRAGGYTTAELSRILTDRYSLYKRDISQVEVVVVEFNSRAIYVFGEVARAGAYSFQEIPDLWNVIMEAGGPTAMAYLKDIRILRGDGEERRSIPVDMNAFLLGGSGVSLPRLQPDDTIYIPKTNVEGMDAFSSNVVYVSGEVKSPGIYMVGQGEDLVGAILLAGGLTEFGDKGSIRLVRIEGERRVVNEVDLDDYLFRGDTFANPLLKSGDTINIGVRKSNRYRKFFEDVRPSLVTVSSVITMFLVVDRISN